MKVIETDDIISPLFSENLKTYVIPVLGNKKKLKSPIKLADGWRYFEDVIILQKNKNKIVTIKDASGVSPERSEIIAYNAWDWARAIWNDMLT